MALLVDRLMLLLILSDMALLGMSRLRAAIGVLAFQGLLLAALALGAHGGPLSGRVLAIAFLGLAVRGVLFPWLLRRVARQVGVARDADPLISYPVSLITGIALLGVAMALGKRLPLDSSATVALVLPATLFTIFAGVFLIVARRKAISQCVGYLVLENGIYGFGVAAVGEVPALIELGALLDLFVAVLVMGVAVQRLSAEFDHVDTGQLNALRG